jgi:hypothetical protein
VTHFPPRHDPVHATAQAPQFAASFCVSTHTPPQRVREGEQTHVLLAHVFPTPHAFPHPPQLFRSVAGSTQTAPQPIAGA